jgi:hypothetical protein
MKKSILYLVLIFLLFNFNLLRVEAAVPSDTVSLYFEALKNGDTESIKNYIAGDFYEKNKDLLNSSTYSEFLKNYYKGATLQVGDSIQSGNDVIVEMQIYFPNGNEKVKKLRLKEYSDNTWKIVGEGHD